MCTLFTSLSPRHDLSRSTYWMEDFNLLKLVIHNTDTFYLPPPVSLVLSVIIKKLFDCLYDPYSEHLGSTGRLYDVFVDLFFLHHHRETSPLDRIYVHYNR